MAIARAARTIALTLAVGALCLPAAAPAEMNRRRFVAGAASAGMGASAVAAGSKNAIFELRYFWLRNGNQAQRTSEFIGKHYLPAARRAGAGPMGFFAAVIAEQSPFLLALTGYSSLAGMESTLEQMASDTEFQKRSSEYDSPNELSYIRMENTLLRGFDTMPQIVVPSSEDSRAARIFERVNGSGLVSKTVRMAVTTSLSGTTTATT